MASTRVVEPLDGVEHVGLGLVPGAIDLGPDPTLVSPAAITGQLRSSLVRMSRSKRPYGFTCPQNRGVSACRSRREAALPGGAGEDLLDHEGVHVDHAVLQQVQAEHAQLLVLAAVAGELAPAGEENEVVGAVPVLDDVQPVVDLAPERLVVQVAAQEDRFHGLP